MPHDHGAVLQVDEVVNLALSTLGAKAAILSSLNLDSSREQGMHCIWCKLAGFFAGKTATEGPILFGLCANLTAGELAAILADDPQNRSVVTSTGPGAWYLPISMIGLDALEGDALAGQGDENVQGTSRVTKYMVKWTIPEGKDLSVFAYNLGSGALTTGMTFNLFATWFGAWLRD